MPIARIVHWKPEEAGPLLEVCRAAGWDADVTGEGPALSRALRERQPDALVIDLSRLPSHGREVAVWIRNTKRTRHIPIVFANGDRAKVEAIKQLLPDAKYADTSHLAAALKSLKPLANPVTPLTMMERYGTRTVAQKLGVAPATTVGVIDPPRDYLAAIGELPQGAEVIENPNEVHPVTVWFVRDMASLVPALPRMRGIAAKSKLWVAWPKGSKNGITNVVREAGIEAGLVDYKICSMGPHWSGILFARKKA